MSLVKFARSPRTDIIYIYFITDIIIFTDPSGFLRSPGLDPVPLRPAGEVAALRGCDRGRAGPGQLRVLLAVFRSRG